MSKKKRLGKGLSALMATPMPVDIESESAPKTKPEVKASTSGVIKHEETIARDLSNTDTSDNLSTEALNTKTSGSQPLEQGDETNSNSQMDRPDSTPGSEGAVSVIYIPCNDLSPNRYQPRQHMDEQALNDLAASIRRDGLMQPIVARQSSTSGLYEIVAGERRWRAAQIAKLNAVPVLVRDLDDQRMAEWAIVENLQREDLNAMDQAEAFGKLVDEFKLSHEEIAERVGKSRSAITNYLRLLDLPMFVQEAVRQSLLSNGHARALLAIPDEDARSQFAERVIREEWSVRQTEKAIKSFNEGVEKTVTNTESKKDARQTHLDDVAKQISDQIGSKVSIKTGRKKGSGKLTIEFYDLDHFDNLIEKLGVQID